MKTIPEIIDMIEAWHIAETAAPDQHGLLAEIEHAIREIAPPALQESKDAEDAKDAARYRWLTYAGWIDDAIMAEHGIEDGISTTLDAAIDAEIAASIQAKGDA